MPPATRRTARQRTASSGARARSRVLRWIDSGALPPALNMGLDEALLRGGGATLRLYGWSPPGLSLGYFQNSREFSRLGGPHVLVRRLTGGGAIYHDCEITFALTVDEQTLPSGVGAAYDLVHAALGRALAGIGVPTTRAPDGAKCPGPRPAECWCMAVPGPGDLVTGPGRKIAGSAQRRIRRPRPRVLHHGSVVLAPPATTPLCGAVAEHADAGASAPVLRLAIARELAAALALRLEPASLSESELRRGRALAARRYEDAAFTHRR